MKHKHLMCFQSETFVFKFLQLIVNGALVCWIHLAGLKWTRSCHTVSITHKISVRTSVGAIIVLKTTVNCNTSWKGGICVLASYLQSGISSLDGFLPWVAGEVPWTEQNTITHAKARTQTAQSRVNHTNWPLTATLHTQNSQRCRPLVFFLVCLLVWQNIMYMYIYIADLLYKSSWFSFYQFSQYRIKGFLYI